MGRLVIDALLDQEDFDEAEEDSSTASSVVKRVFNGREEMLAFTTPVRSALEWFLVSLI